MPVEVVIETGSKRVFASALAWPGWSRSAKDEAAALEALAEYANRYAPVARRAAVRFPAPSARTFTVVARLPGSATTDFGAPDSIADTEWEAPSRAAARRLADLLEASWSTLDEVAAGAPAELRKGPRGGGRDRDAVVQHVYNAEAAYVHKIGLRLRAPEVRKRAAVVAFRGVIAAAVRDPASLPPPGPRPKPWPLRYFVRRTAWHALDHAWEIEDRSEGG